MNQKSSKNMFLIIIIILLVSIVSGMGVYIWTQSKQPEGKDMAASNQRNETEKNPKDSGQKNNNVQPQNNHEQTGSEYQDIDETWQKYINYDLGFSIDIPKESYHGYGAPCAWDGESYRPEGGVVPVSAYEGPDGVYIAHEYTYELGGGSQENGITNFSQCDLVNTSYQTLVAADVPSWKIITEQINNENQLDQFIKDRYGQGCSLGTQTPSNQPGVFDVQIQGDGLDLGQTQCPVNFITVIKYYPAENKVASWHIGQASTFYDSSMSDGYDMEMRDSFRFE